LDPKDGRNRHRISVYRWWWRGRDVQEAILDSLIICQTMKRNDNLDFISEIMLVISIKFW